ncbi:shugoshin 2 [Pelobates fuscus]|uniref:shugoshin 2 n=1 Tax=Pelobates fuscus TaxID=191477 RepID=UPI002FE4AC94
MDLPSSSSLPALQSLKDRMREKINGSLKNAKLSTTLAAKIKTKALNNSSMLKISLKHNNKALACALTVEREKARRLENDKMFLQKEVKMLHFQNALLRQNLNIVNRIFKDIDLFMSINLPTGIEISSDMEQSLEIQSNEPKGDRLSQQSTFSSDGDQGFVLTGVPLRVPSSTVCDHKPDNHFPLDSLVKNPESCTTVKRSLNSSIVKGRSNGPEISCTSTCTSQESHASSNETLGDAMSSKDNEMPNDIPDSPEKNAVNLFANVTKRRKCSTMSCSSSQSLISDCNQGKCSNGENRESNHCSPTEQVTDTTFQFNLTSQERSDDITASCNGNTQIYGYGHSSQPSPTTCLGSPSLKMDSEQVQNTERVSRFNVQCNQATDTTVQSSNTSEGGCGESPAVGGSVAQEQTVYEADMELTTTDSASIVAISSKNKTRTGITKSGIPVKHNGTTLRRVKNSARSKTKATSSQKNESENKDDNLTKIVSKDKTPFDFHIQSPCIDPLTSEVEDHQLSSHSTSSKTDHTAQLCNKSEGRKTYLLTDCIKLENENEPVADMVTENPDSPAIHVPVLSSPNKMLKVNFKENHIPLILEKAQVRGVKRKSSETTSKLNNPKGSKGAEKDRRHSKKLGRKTSKQKNKQKDNQKCLEDKVPSVEVELENVEGISNQFLDNFGNRNLSLRRETYVLNHAQITGITASQSVSRENKFSCRRETYVIPEPTPLEFSFIHSTPEKVTAKGLPGASVPSVIPYQVSDADVLLENNKDICAKTIKKEPTMLEDMEKESHTHCEMENTIKWPMQSDIKNSTLVLQEDKRKTIILPNEKATTLVQESLVGLPLNKTHKQIGMGYLTNEQDSFMLDMVSESVLETVPVLSSPNQMLKVNFKENHIPLILEKAQVRGVKRKSSETTSKLNNPKGSKGAEKDRRHSKKLGRKTSKQKNKQKDNQKCLVDKVPSVEVELKNVEGISNQFLDNFGNRNPSLRRETYVLNHAQITGIPASQSVSRENKFSCRRKAYVIPEPTPLEFSFIYSTPEKVTAKGLPGASVPSVIPYQVSVAGVLLENNKDICAKTIKKEPKMLEDVEKESHTHCEMENTIKWPMQSDIKNSTLVLQEDKRKTIILPNEKATTLVQESLVGLPLNKTHKQIGMGYLTNEQDSFMLDMVSESVLETMIESPSFVRVSSVTNGENSLFIKERSFDNIALVELPGTEDVSHQSVNFGPLDETNCNEPQAYEGMDDLQCEDFNQSLSNQGTATKPLKDLTNTNFGYIKQSPKACSEEEDQSNGFTRRRRNPVNYKEPNLLRKMRREEESIFADLQNYPKCKGKRKKNVKREVSGQKSA